MVQFYSVNSPRIRRLLFRILGPDLELEDTVHDTFVKALESIHTLRDVGALNSWLAGVAIMTARTRIQSRRRRRWLTLMAPESLPEQAHTDCGLEVSEALKVVARVLQDIPADERIAVVLRLAERMTMIEAASVAGVSLSTFKRRFARGEEAFRRLASAEPALASWFEGESE
jgi:RNA polymerase sigma-70 factor (ECF subfamily)